MKSLQQVLGYENLTGVIQDPRGGIPANILPPAFTRVTRKVTGNSVTYDKVMGNRQTARIVQYGSKAVKRELTGVTEISAILMHTVESFNHSVTTLELLRNFDNPMKQQRGEELVAQQTAFFSSEFSNLRLASIYAALANGTFSFDRNGNLLAPGTTGVTNISYGIPASNQGQLNWNGAGNIIATSWATNTADIIGNIKNIKKAAVQLTGYPIRHAFYGQNILSYLASNSTLQNLLRASQRSSEKLLNQEIPDGFLGLNWTPVEQAFFVDNNGAYQTLWGPDSITFTPDPTPDWWEVVEGSYPVPTTLGTVSSDAQSSLGSFSEAFGKFSYGFVTINPPGVEQIAGDTFLPLIKVPKAVFQATVKF